METNKVLVEEVKRKLINDGQCPGTDNPRYLSKALEEAIGYEAVVWDRYKGQKIEGRAVVINDIVLWY